MLRRPLTAAAGAFAAGAAAAGIIRDGSHIMPVVCGGAAALLLLFFASSCCNNNTFKEYNDNFRRRAAALFLVTALFFSSGLIRCSSSLTRSSVLDPYDGCRARVSGTVLSAEPGKEEGRITLTLKLTDGAAALCRDRTVRQRREKLLVQVYKYEGADPASLTGRAVTVSGTVSLPKPASNPGSFDYEKYLRSMKIYACMTSYGDDIRAGGTVHPVSARLAGIKSDYGNRLRHTIDPEKAGIICGIMFGDTAYMPDEITDSFRENGIGHLLAASGLHVGFVYGIINALFRKPRTLTGSLPVFAALVTYAALAGFSASVVRAVFMITVLIISKTAYMRYDFLTSISFCALTLLIYEPAYIFSSGFLLSFMAVTSLAVIHPVMQKIFSIKDEDLREMLPADRVKHRLKKYIAGTLAVTAAIQAGMTPVTLSSFHYISPAGLLINLPAIAAAGVIVPVGIVLIPLTAVPGLPYSVPAFMEEMLAGALSFLNDIMTGRTFSCIYLPSPPTAAILFFYFALFFVCSEMGQAVLRAVRRNPGFRAAAAYLLIFAAGASVCIGAGYACDMDYMKSDLIFVDVGQGDCAHLKTEGMNIMFDSGGSDRRDIGRDTLMPYFLGNGEGTVNLAVISHLHTDHYGGLKTLKNYIKVEKLLLSAAYRSELDQIVKDTGVSAENIIFAEQGDRIKIGGAVIDVLSPLHRSEEEFARLAADEEAENECSMVVRVTCRQTSAIFTGDVDEELEKALISSNSDVLSSDILKLAHHGSRYSSCDPFIDKVSPSAAVIQVGQNTYGHPAPETLNRLKDRRIPVYRNDTQGAVMIKIRNSGTFTVRTMR